MASNTAMRLLRRIVLLSTLAAPVVTHAAEAPVDFMPHPLLGTEPLPPSGPFAFTSDRTDFVQQIAHLAQKSGFRILQQRIDYCPKPKDTPSNIDVYPPWEAADDSTGNVLFDRFGKMVERIKKAERPPSALYRINMPTPGYVLVSIYYLPPPTGGALIANTVVAKN